MSLVILSRADTNEIGSLALNTLSELGKTDRSTDLYYTGVVGNLTKNASILKDVVGFIRKKDFTEQLIVADDEFDRVFNCAKQFIHASTMVLDNAKAQKAEKIWLLFDAHDINLDRLSYEQQIFLTNSLLEELAKPENKAIIDELPGVSTQIDLLRVHNLKLSNLFQQSKEAEAAKANLIAPSTQRRVVRDIMNKDLLPYLEVMSKANPDLYAASFTLITELVNSINSKVRARISRNENHNQEEVLDEKN